MISADTWTATEDADLREMIERDGPGEWPSKAVMFNQMASREGEGERSSGRSESALRHRWKNLCKAEELPAEQTTKDTSRSGHHDSSSATPAYRKSCPACSRVFTHPPAFTVHLKSCGGAPSAVQEQGDHIPSREQGGRLSSLTDVGSLPGGLLWNEFQQHFRVSTQAIRQLLVKSSSVSAIHMLVMDRSRF